jgi:hypothetical protein
MEKLITGILATAFFLASAGQLGKATPFLINQAAQAQQTGLVSLSALNHSLVDRHHLKRH